jgi:dipeptide transport system ATP-binding protein
MDCVMRWTPGCNSMTDRPQGSPLLEVRGLRVTFGEREPRLLAVDGLDLKVARGEIVALVGESGSGKSVSMLGIMGLIDAPGKVQAECIRFDGQDLRSLEPRSLRRLVGRRIGMIFQDPMASLDPCFTVGAQLVEAIGVHFRGSRQEHHERALELLRAVEIPDPQTRFGAFPHELSGGMCQRVMIALALVSEPDLLIADEPTTALDVTIQAQIISMLQRLQRERGLALILISHDLALVSNMADRVIVMYAGQPMESGTAPEIFQTPIHPYTRALVRSLPLANRGQSRLLALPGTVPGRFDRPGGCLLAPRCPNAVTLCATQRPSLRPTAASGAAACHQADRAALLS